MSSSRLGSLDHKAAASLPARPPISPLAVRSPSKSDPPLPSLHSPTAVAPLQHDALLGAPPSHLDTRMPLGERSRTAEALPAFDTSKEVRPSAQNVGKGVTDPAIELISHMVDGKGGEQQLSDLGKTGDLTGVLQSSGEYLRSSPSQPRRLTRSARLPGWSSPVHSPRPGSGSRVSPMSTGNSNWAQQSTTRPSNPRNPSTSNSSATARQPRSPLTQQQQQASRTSPPFGYTPFAQYPSYLDAYNTGSVFQQQPVYPYGGGGYGSPEQQLVYPIDSSTYSSAAPFQSPALQPIASPVAGQPYFDSTGYPPFAPPAPYYASAPTSSMSPSLQPSLSSFGGASGKLSSQQTSSGGGGEGADGDAVYGSDGSPATSQEMFALAQSQHYAAFQQQASPYVPYVPAPFQTPNLGGFGGGYGQGYSPSFGGGQEYPQQPYPYPISSHQQSQGPPSFSPGQQQPSSPYPIPPPPPPPHQAMQPPYPAPYRYFPPAPYGGGYSPVAPFAAAAPSSPLSPPQIYAPPPELARGQLAQSKFHDAVYGGGEGGGGYPRDGRRGSAVSSGGGQGFLGRTLPKPPAHSPHALW